jgi:L-iditol 2-dehydrogenase
MLPATMRAAYLLAPGTIELREVPVPAPASGEVLVRVDAALTCGTDVKMFQRGHAKLPLPAPFGHEFAGTVAAAGAGVQEFAEGDTVMCVPTAPCGECGMCRAERENLCAGTIGRMVLGAYAEYVLLPAHIVQRHLFHRPHHLPPQQAAVLEPLSCVLHGAERIDWNRADSVAIIGDGAIALLFARVAVLRGAMTFVAGRHETRLDIARDYGAMPVHASGDEEAAAALRTFTDGRGPDVVIECVGTPETWRFASEMVAPGGTVLLFGGCAAGAQATFDAYRLHYEEVDLIGAFHYTPRAVAAAHALLVDGTLNAAPLITHSVRLSELRTAIDLMVTREAVKVAVQP